MYTYIWIYIIYVCIYENWQVQLVINILLRFTSLKHIISIVKMADHGSLWWVFYSDIPPSSSKYIYNKKKKKEIHRPQFFIFFLLFFFTFTNEEISIYLFHLLTIPKRLKTSRVFLYSWIFYIYNIHIFFQVYIYIYAIKGISSSST